jgi:hypothetical protein
MHPRTDNGLRGAEAIEGFWGVTVIAKSDAAEFQTETAADGTYQFMSLPAGRYKVSVQPSPKRVAHESPPWNVGAGNPCRVDVQIEYDGTISGLVVGKDGLLTGMISAIMVDADPQTGASWVADINDGQFKLVRLAPGRYRLRFTPRINRRYQTRESYYYPGKKLQEDGSEIVLGDGEHAEGLKFTIP